MSQCLCVHVCMCIHRALTVPMPKVVISCPSLLSARRMFSLISLLATIDRDKNPSAIIIIM